MNRAPECEVEPRGTAYSYLGITRDRDRDRNRDQGSRIREQCKEQVNLCITPSVCRSANRCANVCSFAYISGSSMPRACARSRYALHASRMLSVPPEVICAHRCPQVGERGCKRRGAGEENEARTEPHESASPLNKSQHMRTTSASMRRTSANMSGCSGFDHTVRWYTCAHQPHGFERKCYLTRKVASWQKACLSTEVADRRVAGVHGARNAALFPLVLTCDHQRTRSEYKNNRSQESIARPFKVKPEKI